MKKHKTFVVLGLILSGILFFTLPGRCEEQEAKKIDDYTANLEVIDGPTSKYRDVVVEKKEAPDQQSIKKNVLSYTVIKHATPLDPELKIKVEQTMTAGVGELAIVRRFTRRTVKGLGAVFTAASAIGAINPFVWLMAPATGTGTNPIEDVQFGMNGQITEYEMLYQRLSPTHAINQYKDFTLPYSKGKLLLKTMELPLTISEVVKTDADGIAVVQIRKIKGVIKELGLPGQTAGKGLSISLTGYGSTAEGELVIKINEEGHTTL